MANPRALDSSLRKLRRLNRARAANLRRDALHKLTTSLATQHGTIVVEQLNLVGMARNRRLARRNLVKHAEHVAKGGWETQTPVEPTVRPSLLGGWP